MPMQWLVQGSDLALCMSYLYLTYCRHPEAIAMSDAGLSDVVYVLVLGSWVGSHRFDRISPCAPSSFSVRPSAEAALRAW
jgi:hypothetical protein